MSTSSKILYTKPSITSLEIERATKAVSDGWGVDCYQYVEQFETGFAKYIGCEFALATSSCTGALHLGFAAMGLGPGDEVILADSNWIATVAPLCHLGVKPVFVDILSDTWCIDPSLVEVAITNKTKAILITHLYGNLCDIEDILDIGLRYGVPIIEDSAEAIGAVYHGGRAGSFGLFSTFSFHGTKTLTTGEGGMFVTNDETLYRKVKMLSNHGRGSYCTRQFWPETVGYKYKMSNVQAAIGCAQLERVDELVDRKRQILTSYKSKLEALEGVRLNYARQGTTLGAWMPTVVFDENLEIFREELVEEFNSADIDARVFFWPLSGLDFFESVTANSVAWDIPRRAINLPSYHDMSDSAIEKVVGVLLNIYESRLR